MREIGELLASSAGSNVTTTVPTGLVLLAVGLILCFFGVRSLRLSGFLVGFALAALLADVLGADPLISLVIGVAGGIAGFVLLILVFRFSLWLIVAWSVVSSASGPTSTSSSARATRLSWCYSCLRWVSSAGSSPIISASRCLRC
jgi:hypothetical protein